MENSNHKQTIANGRNMNTDQNKLAKALREVAISSRRNKTARLREIFDEVEAAKAAGASNKTIVATLEANGLIFDVNNFKNARSRILKERALEALTHTPPDIKKFQTQEPLINQSVPKQPQGIETPLMAKPKSNNCDSKIAPLLRPPGVTDAVWSEMQVKAAAAKRITDN